MTAKAIAWLPPDAAEGETVRGALAACVERWSGHWCAAVLPAPDILGRAANAGPAGASAWLRGASGVAVEASRADGERLAALALQAPLEQLVLSEAERDVVNAFVGRLREDLIARIEAALDLGPTAAGTLVSVADPLGEEAGIILSVRAPGGAVLLRSALPMSALVPLLRRAHRGAAACGTPVPVPAALGAAVVRLQAVLGRVRLPLAEMCALENGDVLVLDGLVEAGAELVLAGSGRRLACGGLTEEASRLALALHD